MRIGSFSLSHVFITCTGSSVPDEKNLRKIDTLTVLCVSQCETKITVFLDSTPGQNRRGYLLFGSEKKKQLEDNNSGLLAIDILSN